LRITGHSSGQRDQIGRIFAQWAIGYFGQFFEKSLKYIAHIFGQLFLRDTVMYRFGQKLGFAKNWEFSHKLVWSPWIWVKTFGYSFEDKKPISDSFIFYHQIVNANKVSELAVN
jgi:hypothetical protein